MDEWNWCVCVHSLVIHRRPSSLQQVWGCSSQLGLSFMWRRCTFSQRSAAPGLATPQLTSSSTTEPGATSSGTSGSWRASHLSLGWDSQWCWLWDCMMTEKKKKLSTETMWVKVCPRRCLIFRVFEESYRYYLFSLHRLYPQNQVYLKWLSALS